MNCGLAELLCLRLGFLPSQVHAFVTLYIEHRQSCCPVGLVGRVDVVQFSLSLSLAHRRFVHRLIIFRELSERPWAHRWWNQLQLCLYLSLSLSVSVNEPHKPIMLAQDLNKAQLADRQCPRVYATICRYSQARCQACSNGSDQALPYIEAQIIDIYGS